MTHKRYVVVEGPIAAGKSTLAQRLATHWGASLVTEHPENNPFLARFYRQFQHHALATQLSFMLERAQTAREMLHGELLNQPVVADFLFEKEAMFARLNLDEQELQLYQRLYAAVGLEHPTPDLVIYLQASPETLMSRIADRGLDQEKNFPEGYLKRVHAAYSEFFHQYDAAPLLIVNTDHLNWVDSQDDFDLLLRWINEMRGQRSYFNKSA
jgi:deoxyadenosine/deoxycytidine kinase